MGSRCCSADRFAGLILRTACHMSDFLSHLFYVHGNPQASPLRPDFQAESAPGTIFIPGSRRAGTVRAIDNSLHMVQLFRVSCNIRIGNLHGSPFILKPRLRLVRMLLIDRFPNQRKQPLKRLLLL